MRCRRLLKHLSDYLDRDLEPAIRRHIDSHMRDCKPCRTFIRTLRKTLGVLKRQPAARPRAELKAALRRRLAGC
ncbi:MAG: zf-HC2 domain-containing protein [Elusimicrobia bacterium]|nr:zf-HC2 domain-containing protein [Elusimicrobiota bacterium]